MFGILVTISYFPVSNCPVSVLSTTSLCQFIRSKNVKQSDHSYISQIMEKIDRIGIPITNFMCQNHEIHVFWSQFGIFRNCQPVQRTRPIIL